VNGKLIFLVLFPLLASACAVERDRPVGLRFCHYSDASRRSWSTSGPRPLETLLWYPAKKGTKVNSHTVAIFRTGAYAVDAAFPEGDRKYPLILLSHGTGGSAFSLAWLAEALAREGYIVAALNHHGNTGAEPKYLLQGFILWWERPQDIRAVLDRLLEDETLRDRIDRKRIGVAGFSLGGYTALSAVGARLAIGKWGNDPASWERGTLGRLPPEASFSMVDAKRMIGSDDSFIQSIRRADDSYLDDRIKAAFVIAPPLGPLLNADSLSKIGVPVKIIVGSRDDQAVPEENAIPIADHIPGAELEIVEGAGHYVFLCEGSFMGMLADRTHLVDPSGVDRAKIHERVGNEACEFFDRSLSVEYPLSPGGDRRMKWTGRKG
jgi:predicted dienelactone hydrolase